MMSAPTAPPKAPARLGSVGPFVPQSVSLRGNGRGFHPIRAMEPALEPRCNGT
jgi:hypothetical protein